MLAGPNADDSELAMTKLLEVTRAIEKQTLEGKDTMAAINFVVQTQLGPILE